MKITPEELRHYASEPRDYRLIEKVLLDAAETIEQLEQLQNERNEVNECINVN